MPHYLYKYAGSKNIDRIFSDQREIAFKCSYPKEFNDPYELFLTIDFKQDPSLLAFYEDAIGEMPQLPTTCFSKSPTVIPMWAHYANNHEGFSIEIDEQKLAAAYPESEFGNIDYQDKPHESIQDTLDRAFHIGKPRYMYFLHKAVFSAAYFTKNSCWNYEMERRMVLSTQNVRDDAGLLLLDIPHECVNAIIAGSRATDETKLKLRQHADTLKCHFYEMKIGRSSTTPFYKSKKGRTFIFNGSALERSKKYCSSCGEPVQSKITKCSWCQISDAHKIQAANRNPYRALARAGILDSYIQGMENISRGARRS